MTTNFLPTDRVTMRNASLNCLWIGLLSWMLVSCAPKETQVLLQPAGALGTVLAQETAQLAGGKKRVAVIVADATWGPPSVAEEAFDAALKKRGIVIVTTKAVNLGDPMRLGKTGLKAEDFFEVLEKYPDVGAIVSFAGLPLLQSADITKIPPDHPPILVVATATLGEKRGVPSNQTLVAQMVEAKLIKLAIIDGAADNSQDSHKLDAVRELFAGHFHILRPFEANPP